MNNVINSQTDNSNDKHSCRRQELFHFNVTATFSSFLFMFALKINDSFFPLKMWCFINKILLTVGR